MQQIMDCWKMNNGGHHVVSSCTRKRSSLSFVQVGEDCQDQEEEEDEEFWIPCIAFMMAFKIFKQRMESQSYIVISRPPRDCNNHGDVGPSSSCCCFTFSKQDKSRDDIVMDPVMVGAVRLIHWSKLLASFVMKRFHNHHHDDDDGHNDHNDDDDDDHDDDRDDLNNRMDNPLRQLFGKEFDWIDAFVDWMEEKPSLSCRADNNSTDNGIMDHERNETVRQPISVQDHIINNEQEEINHLQQLWTYFDVRYHHGNNQQVSDDSNESKSSNVAGDVDIKTKMTSNNQVLNGDEKHSKEKTYVINAIDLRPDLLKMSKNAISQEITVMAEKIVTLLDDAGSKDGAMGIEMVATVLATGNAIMQQQQQGSSIDVEQLDLEIFPFSDSLLASITKRYVTEEMSSARICSFLGSFVLPSITALARKESRPASRQLVTMLMNLARDRPCEVMSALVIPTMNGVAYLTTSTHCKKHQISKGQTELFTRLIKSKSFSTDDMSKLASELVHIEWTDQSVSVFMTCLQRKPILSSATFSKLVERICMCCNEKILVASSNFSSFFHLIVNKYNSQVKQERCEDALLRAAKELTTYMKKTIISAITKLQNEG
jgi:hypothetical protein